MLAKFIIGLVLICGLFGTSNAKSLDQQDNCPEICPDNYDPVCATNGRTVLEFPNQCEFVSKNCHSQKASMKPFVTTVTEMCHTELVVSLDKLLTKLGDLDLTKSGCLKPCTLSYKPVCISNGKLRYPATNQCIMNTINCALGNQESKVTFTLNEKTDGKSDLMEICECKR